MNTISRTAALRSEIWIGAILVVAILVGVVALVGIDPSGEEGNKLPPSAVYDIQQYKEIDPALIQYRQTGTIPLDMTEARALEIGPQDRIYVAGDKRILIFDAEGKRQSSLDLEDEPRCLAVASEAPDDVGRLFVGMATHVEVYQEQAGRIAQWQSPGRRAVLTSIALGEEDVFVADAGRKLVLRYDRSGKLLGEIGRRDPQREIPGFVIPSPYFDLLIAPDGLLRVVNPGLHRIETYTPDGRLEVPLVWGKPSRESEPRIAGFCGCCNPAHLAMFPDGRFLTSEKGIPRVKVYRADGTFQSVVAGPKTLAPTPTAEEETRTEFRLQPVDVAADSRSRVLILDPAARSVRVFQHKKSRVEEDK